MDNNNISQNTNENAGSTAQATVQSPAKSKCSMTLPDSANLINKLIDEVRVGHPSLRKAAG